MERRKKLMAILYTPPQCRTFSPPVFNYHVTGETIKFKTSDAGNWCSRFRSKSLSLVFSGALALGLSLSGSFHMTSLPWHRIEQILNLSFFRRRWTCRSSQSGSKQTRTAPKRVHFGHRCCWFPLWWPGLICSVLVLWPFGFDYNDVWELITGEEDCWRNLWSWERHRV